MRNTHQVLANRQGPRSSTRARAARRRRWERRSTAASRWRGRSSTAATRSFARSGAHRCSARMSGESGPERTLGDPALYVLQCALTALWSSVGVRPGVVVGFGAGELAAAHAAGVLSLEEGLRLAVGAGRARGKGVGGGEHRHRGRRPRRGARGHRAQVPRHRARERRRPAGWWGPGRCARRCLRASTGARAGGPPDGVSGRWRSGEWRWSWRLALAGRSARWSLRPGRIPRTGAEEVGNGARGPVVLSGPGPADGDGSAPNGDAGFARAVAGAYEAGLPVAFAGLFAGETRRRISVPGYPFERRRYWIESPDR